MRVSFIIPHKGREELLERTLQSILELEFNLKEVEVIVVTQNKVLECPNIDRKILPFKILFRPEHETISSLRNIGVEHASGEYLVFLDADIQLSHNWLDVMFKEFQADSERVLVSAVQRCEPEAGIIEKIRVIMNNTSADSHVQFLDGRNLFTTRRIFEDVGGFPEHLVTCEDYYFTNNVHQIGDVYVTSQASYIHLGEDKNYAELFQKEIWRGQSNLQSIRGRKILLREIPSVLTPVWQVFFLLVTIIFLGTGKIALGLFSLTMFCLPIILYSLRLYRIGRQDIGFTDSFRFYCIYLIARAIGTPMGVFRVIRLYSK